MMTMIDVRDQEMYQGSIVCCSEWSALYRPVSANTLRLQTAIHDTLCAQATAPDHLTLASTQRYGTVRFGVPVGKASSKNLRTHPDSHLFNAVASCSFCSCSE
jgi:hypothetical protein